VQALALARRALRPAAMPLPFAASVDLARGRVLYLEACQACHGVDGAGGHGGGPTLLEGLRPEAIVAITSLGRNAMPGFGGVYSEAHLRDVAAYIAEELATQ
jgi:mono/diheme cytochrome c family protein